MLRTIIVVCLVAACFGSRMLDRLEKQLRGSRILGGSDANIEDYSYMLSLELYGEHFCGAAIFQESWALTAASCVMYSEDVTEYKLRAGSSVIHAGGMLHQVIRIIKHPKFSLTLYTNYDIALLQVETPFNLGVGVSIIPLPEQGQDTAAGSLAVVTGWGYSAMLPLHLQVVSLPVIAQSECKRFFDYLVITDQTVCTGVEEEGSSTETCLYDEGGPMVVAGELVGVVTYDGWRCSRYGTPSTYSRVSSVRDWIDAASAGQASDNSFFESLYELVY